MPIWHGSCHSSLCVFYPVCLLIASVFEFVLVLVNLVHHLDTDNESESSTLVQLVCLFVHVLFLSLFISFTIIPLHLHVEIWTLFSSNMCRSKHILVSNWPVCLSFSLNLIPAIFSSFSYFPPVGPGRFKSCWEKARVDIVTHPIWFDSHLTECIVTLDEII